VTDAAAVVDVLRAARERLSEPGVWAQGVTSLDGDRCCLTMALSEAGCLRLHYQRAPNSGANPCKAVEAMAAATGISGLTSWNDTPGRTLDEVLAVLDVAIERAEREAGR